MAGLTDVLTSMQAGVEALANLQQTQAKLIADFTTGLLTANALIIPGFVRVLGVSIVDGSVVGFLHDAAALADADSTNQIYVLSTTKGFYPLQMVVQKGLVFKIGTANKIVVFYSRT